MHAFAVMKGYTICCLLLCISVFHVALLSSHHQHRHEMMTYNESHFVLTDANNWLMENDDKLYPIYGKTFMVDEHHTRLRHRHRKRFRSVDEFPEHHHLHQHGQPQMHHHNIHWPVKKEAVIEGKFVFIIFIIIM